jgi:hypothetical protein
MRLSGCVPTGVGADLADSAADSLSVEEAGTSLPRLVAMGGGGGGIILSTHLNFEHLNFEHLKFKQLNLELLNYKHLNFELLNLM